VVKVKGHEFLGKKDIKVRDWRRCEILKSILIQMENMRNGF